MSVATRDSSPTRILWDNRRATQETISKMSALGLHVFNPEWSGYHSSSFRECTLGIYGSKETITIPVQVCTKVADVKAAIAVSAGANAGDLQFVMKNGCSWRQQDDHSEVASKVMVRGIKSFSPLPWKWPRPTVILGAGYNGIKNALLWAHEGSTDFMMFDRYSSVGGHAWQVQANKTSKLQTEFAAFHVWFGDIWDDKNEKLGYPTEWETWPHADQINQHMHYACERYGLLPHIRFRVNCTALDIVGKITDPDRNYLLTIESLDKDEPPLRVEASNVYHFPGAYFNPRIIVYPGEQVFGGQIGYGMNNDIPYDYIDGNQVAILGNGAFAVENIRTCCEYGATKIYLVTRRKNLPSPRLCCWFVHQGIVPVPAGMLLKTFEPMFKATNFGDPWEYWSVHASNDRKTVQIRSNSRFGIGDVTFLAHATGRCEYVQDLLKRCTHHALHLEGGRKLDGVSVIIKALGLLADFQADKLQKIKEMIGPWISGDHRRVIYADPLGMNAQNFFAFSTGIGSHSDSVRNKYLIDFPHEWRKLENSGVIDMMPRNKAGDDRPAHQYDAKYAQTVGVLIEGTLPGIGAKMANVGVYMHRCFWAVNPLDKFLEECERSWNQYQVDWKKQGLDYEYVPYPYTAEIVMEWFEEYGRTVGPTSEEDLKQRMAMVQGAQQSSGPAEWNAEDAKRWWRGNCEVYKYTKTTKSYASAGAG